MSVQFESVKENIPKGFNIQKRSSDENIMTFKLQKSGMNSALSGLGIPMFLVGLFSCSAVAGTSVDSGSLDTGPAITLGAISGIAAFSLCIYLVVGFFTQDVKVTVTPEFIQINEKKYDPKLFGGFMSGQQVSEWMTNHTTNITTEDTTTQLSWIYGGEQVSLKGGFKGSDPSEVIRLLNRLVQEIHPTVHTR